MPVHDWTLVEAGIFHHFHHGWIWALSEALNRGILPPDHYALAEQLTGEYGPDVLTLEAPSDSTRELLSNSRTGIALAEVEPRVSFRARADDDIYAAKANHIAIRHVSDHRVVAVIEVVSPGNKNARGPLRAFVEKAAALLRGGIHWMIIDLFPPTPRDPEGIHRLIWEELTTCDLVLPQDRPLTLASYTGGLSKQAFVEPVAVGMPLPDMPLFITTEFYVPAPLETTYQTAWQAVPPWWRKKLDQ